MNYSEIKSLLNAIDDPVLKLETVMDLGKQIDAMPQSCARTAISGCASRVEVCRHNGRFYASADSMLVRGIVAILIAMANDGTKDMRQGFASLNLQLGAGRMTGADSIINYLEKM